MKNSGEHPESSWLAGSLKTAVTQVGPACGEYLALPLHNLVAGSEVPFEVMVRTNLSGEKNGQFQTCTSPGQTFEGHWLEKLREAGVSRVYCHRRDQDLVFDYLNLHLPQVLQDKVLTPKEKAAWVVDVTYFWLDQFFTNFEAQATEQLRQGFGYVDHVLTCFRQDHYQRQWVLDMCRHDQNLYSHCLNTTLLAMGFASHLGWEDEKIQKLGQGALLHDIGMTRIPTALLKKKGRLSEADWELVKKHPHSGYVMLKTLSLMKRESLLLVLQHHENGDGSGYPEGLKISQMHLFARVMRIIDSFEALISPRSWRPSQHPAKALWVMRQEWQENGIFDPGILIQFIKFVGGDKK